MTGTLKQVNKVAVLEIAFGFAVGVILISLLSSIFGRMSFFHADAENADAENADLDNMSDAEYAEHMENLRGKGRARRASKQTTRAKKKMAKTSRAQQLGKKQGSAGASAWEEEIPDGGDEGGGEYEEEEYAEYLETAEYLDSLDAEDIDNMSDAEYAEYLEAAEYIEQFEMADQREAA